MMLNNAGWDYFKTPILREILRTQNPLLDEHYAFSGSRTLVPKSSMCQKQTSVWHSPTKSEITSLDSGLRLDGIPALDLCDLIVAVLGNTNQNQLEQGDLLKNKREVCSPPHTIHKRTQSQRVINDLDNVDLFLQTINLLIKKLCCMCLKTTKQWSRWSKMEKARQWDMFPEPTELLLFGYSIESIWTQYTNQIHWHQKPSRRHTDQGKLHTWWMESSFVFV